MPRSWALFALALFPLLVACDDEPQARPPERLCDDIPYQWAVDATAQDGLATGRVNGRIAVTPADNDGFCSIKKNDGGDIVLGITTKLRTAKDAAAASESVEERLKAGKDTAISTPQGKGIVIAAQNSDDPLRSFWVCSGVTLDIEMGKVEKADQATDRLKSFTERIASLMTCRPPLPGMVPPSTSR